MKIFSLLNIKKEKSCILPVDNKNFIIPIHEL